MNIRSLPCSRRRAGRPQPATGLRRCIAFAAAVALLGTAGLSGAAQYQWRDERGRMVYSDLPPPASIAPERIIKVRPPAPPTAPAPASVPSAAPSIDPASVPGSQRPLRPSGNGAVAATANPAAAAPSFADQELALRKRIAERAEQEKKAAEAAEREARLAQVCADAQGDIRSLESGQRISRVNAAGESEIVSDAEREKRLQTARKRVRERC